MDSRPGNAPALKPGVGLSDVGNMLHFNNQVRASPPMSNAERQRQFRARNPGYYGRLHRKRNAEIDARRAKEAAQKQADQAAQEALRIPTQRCLPAPTPPLTIQLSLFAQVEAPLRHQS